MTSSGLTVTTGVGGMGTVAGAGAVREPAGGGFGT